MLPRVRRRVPPTLGVLEAIGDLAVVACHNAEAYEDVRAAASTDALTGLLALADKGINDLIARQREIVAPILGRRCPRHP